MLRKYEKSLILLTYTVSTDVSSADTSADDISCADTSPADASPGDVPRLARQCPPARAYTRVGKLRAGPMRAGCELRAATRARPSELGRVRAKTSWATGVKILGGDHLRTSCAGRKKMIYLLYQR